MATRLRVFERPDGTRYVIQATQAETDAHASENPTHTLVR